MLFDFDRAEILGQIFYLEHRYVVTDMVETELKSLNVPLLKKLGLRVVELSGEQVRELATLRKRYKGPGIKDLSALAYARSNSLPLLTRDSLLQEAASAEGVVVYETHTLLEELIDQGQLKRAEAADALSIMNSRLRTHRLDWDDLIKKWRRP